jgi:hypothetical protein
MNKSRFISQLPRIPKEQELVEMKKRVKKKKRPSIKDGDSGGHEELGFFTVYIDDETLIEWNIKNGIPKKLSYDELCVRAEYEMERLEIGWLIGNICSLNKLCDQEKLGVPAGEAALQEYARISNWYEKKEKTWYEWAVAKP